jgi:hypothetical protein
MPVERARQIGADNGVDFAGLQKIAKRFAALVRHDIDRAITEGWP